MLNIQSYDVVFGIGCSNGAHLENIERITRSCVGIDFSVQPSNTEEQKGYVVRHAKYAILKFAIHQKISAWNCRACPQTQDVLMQIKRITKRIYICGIV